VSVSVSRSAPPTRRPDPALGVFETLLVLDDRPVELDAHLARLRSSLATLYPDLTVPRVDVPVDRGPLSTGMPVEVLRIAVAPDADGQLAAAVERRPATGHFATEKRGKVTARPISLCSMQLRGGLGAHKWGDRSLLDEAQKELPADTLPLIFDGGAVLEASRANVFVVRDGVLLTPPLDGRILPGVTRAQVLEIARSQSVDAEEKMLIHDDLLAADEVFLTGSVRGVEPVVSLDGTPLTRTGGIAERLAAELRRAWAGLKAAASFG
jgi:para-aminobenzoate synthetase / 4-amino-4-deoxychorismate lyase